MAGVDLTRFDFNAKDFIHSDNIRSMNLQEIGQYILLLCEAWLTAKDASLPDDMDALTNICRGKAPSDKVLKMFPLAPEIGRRRNARLYGEWVSALKRSNDGKAAVESRWQKKGNTVEIRSYNEPSTDSEEVVLPNPIQSNPNQTKPNQNSIEFSGGSFGQGSFKMISARWWSHFQKQLQKSKQNKEQYALACSQFNEDKILDYLEVWAKENSWVSSHPKGGNRLYVFLQALPEMIEGDGLRTAREKEAEKKDGPQISEQELQKFAKKLDEKTDQEVAEELKKIADRKKFEEETRDQI